MISLERENKMLTNTQPHFYLQMKYGHRWILLLSFSTCFLNNSIQECIVYLLILRIHCCDAFSLSQSVLWVGSQEATFMWDRRPAPATPATPPIPSPTPWMGDVAWTFGPTATSGCGAPGLGLPKVPVLAAGAANTVCEARVCEG